MKRNQFIQSMSIAAVMTALSVAAPGMAMASCPVLPEPPIAEPALCSFGTVDDISKKVFVSTRSGLQNGGFKVIVRDANNLPIAGVEVWLSKDSGTGAYTEQLEGVETVCALAGYPECPSLPDNLYTYVESHTDGNGVATFTQGWGGSGAIEEIQLARFCPAAPCQTPHGAIYQIINQSVAIPFRSTDMNADGKWDECDRATFQPCMNQSSPDCLAKADFNLDGTVNSADLTILTADITNGCGEDLTTCGEADTGQSPGCAVEMVGVISNLTIDWVGPTQVGLTWTAPGAQGSSGTVAGYQVRYSTAPITNCNFSSATLAGKGPLPLAPGNPQSYTISSLSSCQTYYFAVKAFTSAGLVAAVSNVPSTQTTCSKTADVAGGPEALELSIVDGNAVRGGAHVSYGVPSADAGKDGRLAIFDAAGRHIRTLVSGPIEQGRHLAVWDLRSDGGEPMLAGVYFARLSVGENQLSRTLVVLAE